MEVNLKFKLSAGEAKAEASLIRTLTQYGLNATKFCTDFNEKSIAKFPKGLLIVAKIKVDLEKKTYLLELDSVMDKFVLSTIDEIRMENLYDMYRILKMVKPTLSVETYFGIMNSLRRNG